MKTDSFSVPTSKYVRTVFTEYFKQYWWMYLLPLLVLVSLIAVNVNFIYVTLMAIFIIYPMVLSFVYFSYCLTKEIRWSILTKTIESTDVGLKLEFDDFDKLISWGEIDGYKTTKDGLLLQLKGRKFTYVIVPYSVFQGDDSLKEFVGCLRTNDIRLK